MINHIHIWILKLSIFHLFIINITPLTQLSKSNCPSKFYISRSNITNITKQQALRISQNFYSIYDQDNLKKNIQNIVVQGNTKELSNYINSTIIPFAIIAMVGLIIVSMLTFCCIFDTTCPPKFIRRDLGLKPYSLLEFKAVTFTFLILSCGIVITSCIGFSYIPQLKTSVQLTTCSVYVALDSILNGQNKSGWGGFNNLYTKIGNVAEYLNDSLYALTNLLSGDEWLIQQMKQMQQNTFNIYKHNNDSKMIKPNPKSILQAITNGYELPQIQSVFITNQLGPLGKVGSLVDDIFKGLKITQVLATKAYQIQIASKRLVDSSVNLLTNTNTSLNNMDMYIGQINKVVNQTNTFQSEIIKKYFHISLTVFQGIYGVELVGSMMCIMGILAVYYFEVWSCRIMSAIGWVLTGFGFAGIMVICFTTLGLGSLGYGFCTYFDSMLTQKLQYEKLSAYNAQNMFSRIDSCFYGDGNVLQKFNLGNQMQTVTSLFENIKQYYDYQDVLSTNYIDKTIPITRMTKWMTIIQNYKKGIYVDYKQDQKSDDNPNFSIETLNSFTLNGSGKHICSKDRWVFDVVNCTNIANETTYQAGTFQNGHSLSSDKAGICISFNQKLALQYNNIWSQGDFMSRYKKIRTQCNQTYDTILSYGQALIKYRNSRMNLFQGINDQIQSIKTNNMLFNNNITIYKNKLWQFQNQVSALNNAVSNSLDGLLVSNDCRKIVDSLKFVYNMFCVNTMYNFIKIGWTGIILSIFSLLSMIFGYIFTQIFADLQKNKKIMSTFTGVDELASQQDIELNMKNNNKQLGIMNDFEKLKILGINKQKRKKNATKIVSYDSQQSSDQDNPYTKQLKQ